MANKFATLIDICDDAMPTWLKWDLLALAPSEQFRQSNNQGAAKYRISDGKRVKEFWVILDHTGSYRRVSMRLENELNAL